MSRTHGGSVLTSPIHLVQDPAKRFSLLCFAPVEAPSKDVVTSVIRLEGLLLGSIENIVGEKIFAGVRSKVLSSFVWTKSFVILTFLVLHHSTLQK